MTEWTVERLDALPEGTLIECDLSPYLIECDLSPYPSKHEWFVRLDGGWEIDLARPRGECPCGVVGCVGCGSSPRGRGARARLPHLLVS